VPFISAVVFLSDKNVINKLNGPARQHVYTRDNFIHSISHIDQNWRYSKMDTPIAKMLSRAVDESGIKESMRMRRVGQYDLTDLITETDLYQDWLGKHTDAGVKRKVRIYLTRDKSDEDAKRLHKAAQLEFRLLDGIEHIGILKTIGMESHDH